MCLKFNVNDKLVSVRCYVVCGHGPTSLSWATLESAGEEEDFGSSLPEEEEKRSVGDEQSVSAPPGHGIFNTALGCGRSNGLLGALLVHFDVPLMVEFLHRQATAVGNASEIGTATTECILHAQSLQYSLQRELFPYCELRQFHVHFPALQSHHIRVPKDLSLDVRQADIRARKNNVHNDVALVERQLDDLGAQRSHAGIAEVLRSTIRHHHVDVTFGRVVEPCLLSPAHGEWVPPVSTEYEGVHCKHGGVLGDAARR